jgi:hypothetical protein
MPYLVSSQFQQVAFYKYSIPILLFSDIDDAVVDTVIFIILGASDSFGKVDLGLI